MCYVIVQYTEYACGHRYPTRRQKVRHTPPLDFYRILTPIDGLSRSIAMTGIVASAKSTRMIPTIVLLSAFRRNCTLERSVVLYLNEAFFAG